MNTICYRYFAYGMATLLWVCLSSAVFSSLRATGDAGLQRLLDRASGRQLRRLEYWRDRWMLLRKTARIMSTLGTIATFILFYEALRHCAPWLMAAGLFLLSLPFILATRVVPHVLAESHADRISLAALPAVAALTRLLYLFVWPLQAIEDRLLHHALSASDTEGRPSPEDEIRSLIEESNGEEFEEEEREIIRSALEFGDTLAREIMTPRIDIEGLKDALDVEECVQIVKESRHSRFPVYHENIDDVKGVVHVKDLLRRFASGEGRTPIGQLVKKIDFVPESMPISDLMQLMKRNHAQVVLVVDEYGGTEGLVTMEDIVEELVGEIDDEYDLQAREIHRRPDGSVVVQARASIYELNEELDGRFPESDEYDSLGGYIISLLGRIPKTGETLRVPGYEVRIQSATARHIQIVLLTPAAAPQEA